MSKFSACSLPEPIIIIPKTGQPLNELPAHVLKAARLLHQGQAKNALATLNNAATANPESVWGWIIAVTAHCRQDNFKTALEVAERGLQQVGKNSYLLDCLGVALCGIKDYINAQNSFLHAIQADASNTNAFVNLAQVFLSQNHPDAAFETLQQGLKQNPDSPEIKLLFIQLHPAWSQPLVGGKLRLRMMSPHDEDFLARCYADQSFMNSYHRFAAINQSRPRIQRNLKQNPSYSVLKQKSVHWLIEQAGNLGMESSSYQPIGLACFAEIHLLHQRAEVLIGFPDKTHRGQSRPLAAMLLLLDFAFNRIGFNKITSIVYGDNHYSQRNTLALGFTQEGFRPKHLRDLQTGQWLDIYDNGLLQSAFRSNARLARLSEHLLGFDITRSTMGKAVFEQ